MKASIIAFALLGLLSGCVDYGFSDDFRSYGEPTATRIENDIVVDEFRAVHLDPVDILFVIDDSCSMSDDQNELADHLPKLGRTLLQHDMNYRVGFTTGTYGGYGDLIELPTNRGYEYWITPDSRAKTDLFVYGATPGTSGYGSESGLYASWATVNTSYTGAGFLRPNSSFHVITISDEIDQADDIASYYDLSHPKTAKAYSSWLNGLRSDSTFSIIQSGHYDQIRYRKTARQTGGYIMDIEDPSWDDFFIEFVDNIEFAQEFRFHLSHIPADPDGLLITVCIDIDHDGKCVSWYDSPDITHVYKKDKKGWTYEYDPPTNSVLLVSSKRSIQNYDYVTITYEIPTGSPKPDEE